MFIAKTSAHVIGGDDQPYQVCADGERGPHRRDQKLSLKMQYIKFSATLGPLKRR